MLVYYNHANTLALLFILFIGRFFLTLFRNPNKEMDPCKDNYPYKIVCKGSA